MLTIPNDYSFRLRFRIPSRHRIAIASRICLLTPEDVLPAVTLASGETGKNINEAGNIVVTGSGHATEVEAERIGESIRDALSVAFARLHVAADFGDRAAHGRMYSHALSAASKASGVPVLNNVHGLMTFETFPAPSFIGMSVSGARAVAESEFLTQFHAAYDQLPRLIPRARLAFDLYSASSFESSPDARLMTLMMAVETMIDLQPRSPAAQKHVRQLLEATKRARVLSTQERDSLRGCMKWMLNESISHAGKRLASRLGNTKYMGMESERFFSRCYSVRSALAHGRVPRPSRAEVDRLAAHLQVFVGDLLVEVALHPTHVAEEIGKHSIASCIVREIRATLRRLLPVTRGT